MAKPRNLISSPRSLFSTRLPRDQAASSRTLGNTFRLQQALFCKGYDCLEWEDSRDLGVWTGSRFNRGNGEWRGKREEGLGRNVHSEQRDGVVGVRAGWERVEKLESSRREGRASMSADCRRGPVSTAQEAQQCEHKGCKASECQSLCCEIIQASVG